MAYHGFNGIEQEVVTKIAEWITRKDPHGYGQRQKLPTPGMQSDARGKDIDGTSH